MRYKPGRERGGAWIFVLPLAIVTAVLPGCRSQTPEAVLQPVALQLTSPVFAEGGVIPRVYTCTGGGVTPPLAWGGLPAGTKSLTLILERTEEADDVDGLVEGDVHWIVYNIPPELSSLPEGYRLRTPVDGSSSGTNDFGVAGYDGPCPPKGEFSRYAFHLYAVSDVLNLRTGARTAEVLAAIDGRALGRGRLSLRYGYETF